MNDNQLLPPTELEGKALEFYQRIIPDLIKKDLINQAQLPFMEALCMELAFYFDVRGKVKNRLNVKGQKGERKIDPRLREARNALQTAFTIGKEYGLTPKALIAMGYADPEQVLEDPIEKLMKVS